MSGNHAGNGMLTADAYARFVEPDDAFVSELVRGRLVREPRPGDRHGALQAWLASKLATFVHRRKLGRVLTDVGSILARDPDTVRGPDIAFVSAARLTGPPAHGFLPFAPDLVVEILSPSNRPGDMLERIRDFLEAGARLVWVIDPETRTVRVQTDLDHPARLRGADTLDGGTVLPGFALPLPELFQILDE